MSTAHSHNEMQQMRELDFNTPVKVRLTDHGRQILAANGIKCPPENNGYSKWRLSSLILTFNGHFRPEGIWPFGVVFMLNDEPQATPLSPEADDGPEPPAPATNPDSEVDTPKTLAVNLTYFKENGKFYDHGELSVPYGVELHDIWAFVWQLDKFGQLPGLISGGRGQYNILVEVPEHPNAHPHLIMCASSDQP